MRCKTLSEIVGEVNRLIDEDRKVCGNRPMTYCFRGECLNYLGSDDDELGTAFDSLLDRRGFYTCEREIYEEALRWEVASFEHDRSIIERLARMQHYRLPTRLADVSQNAFLSVHFAIGNGETEPEKRDNGRDGFIRVIRIDDAIKLKSYTSDIIAAISHLPCVDAEDVDPTIPHGLGKLVYAVQNDLPAFHDEHHWAEIGEQLRKDIGQVWAFRPILNSARVRNQSGVFLAFGCGRYKEPLRPTFSLADYDNEEAPSYGIAQIGYVRIAANAKSHIREELCRFGMEPERVYPELSDVCQSIDRRYQQLSHYPKYKEIIMSENRKISLPDGTEFISECYVGGIQCVTGGEHAKISLIPACPYRSLQGKETKNSLVLETVKGESSIALVHVVENNEFDAEKSLIPGLVAIKGVHARVRVFFGAKKEIIGFEVI